MSNAINYVQNSVSIPRYNRQQQINTAENRISQIDRQIAKKDEQSGTIRELITARKQIISNNDKLLTLRTEHLNTLKESRDLQVDARDITAKLLACYEKLLEIRREKNNPETVISKVSQSTLTTGKDQPPNPNSNTVDKSDAMPLKQVFAENVRALGKELEYKPTDWVKVNTPRLPEYANMYSNFIKNNKEFVKNIDSNSEKILSNKNILETYNKSLSGANVGSRIEEDAIAKIIEENTGLQKLNSNNFKQMRQARNEYYDFINTKIKAQTLNSTDKTQEVVKYTDPINNSRKLREEHLAIQTSKPVGMAAITADATQKLGELLFDKYKDVNTTAATNLRERFFEDLEYDATRNIASVNSNLSKVFDNFATYLKIGEYSYLNNHKNYLYDLQTKLMRFDKWC